jgi:hypothetical protein
MQHIPTVDPSAVFRPGISVSAWRGVILAGVLSLPFWIAVLVLLFWN